MASVRRILSGSQFSDEALSRRLTEWETRALDALRTQLGPEEFERATRFASRLPLHRLSTSVQASLMNDYRSIIGLDQVLTHFGYSGGTVDHKTLQIMGTKTGVSGDFLGRMGAMWGSLRTMRGINDPNPFGRMPFDIEEGSLIERIYSQLNVQWRPRVVQGVSGIADPKTTVAGPSRYFTVGRSSIPTMASMNRPTSLPSFVGKKVAVFDIETAGLIPGQIRSLAVSDLVGDSTGRLIGRGRPTETVFRASEMRRGAAYWQGQFISTEEFVERRFGAKVSHLTGTGDEFASRMEPFLQKILDSDYIVGHNIAQFDIEQIFTSLAGTQRFKNDQKFAALVDEAYKQAREKTIDTLEIVRANKNLAGLTTHRAISEFGQAFSIENLLLRTNLATIIGLDELAAAMGYQDGIFTRGLHHADVDTLITRALLEHQDEIRIKRGGMKAGFTGDRAVLARRIEQSIIQSGAITPWSNIRDIEAIAPALRGMGPVSYMQQHIWSQRNLGMGIEMDPGIAPSPVETAQRINLFDRMKAKGIETVQQRLAAVNTPFAGLSMEERAFGTRLSRATASLAPDPQAARYATDALISHFHGFSPTDIQWMGYHGRATIDPRILADIGLLGGDSPQLLSMSAVDRTAAHDRRSVNLVMGLDDDQIQKLSARLKVLADDQDEFARILGLSGDDAVSAHRHFKNAMERGLIGQLTEHGRERGITIAQLHDDPGMVDEVFDLMRQFHITEQLRDKDTTQMALAFLGLEDDGTVRTTGSILNFGLDAVQMENIGRHVQLAATAEANARAVANDRTASTFANMLAKARTEEHADAIMRGIRAYTDVVRPNIGKISIGALGATAGLLLLARKREQDRFDVATDPMPAQQQNYAIAQHVANRMASPGFDGYRQQIDPLATASLVANLHANQLGHDNLRWDRNSNLYGGLL